MIQIAIWGIAIMLVVKAVDILHQQSISNGSEHPGSVALSTGGAVIAILGAVGLVYIADQQVKASPNPFSQQSSFGSTESEPSAAELQQMVSNGVGDAAELEAMADKMEAEADASAKAVR